MTNEARSRIMRAVKSSDTEPEKAVRRIAHRMGYRFRLHYAALPGKPDLAFPSRRAVIFVHGCFWHSHDCERGSRPRTNAAYWAAKLARNVERDAEQLAQLKNQGWRTLVIWECEIADANKLRNRLRRLLS